MKTLVLYSLDQPIERLITELWKVLGHEALELEETKAVCMVYGDAVDVSW